MRILNFEDDVYKANDIKKALNDRCGVTDVTQVDNVEEGLELLIQEKEVGNPFDLIITDMQAKREISMPDKNCLEF